MASIPKQIEYLYGQLACIKNMIKDCCKEWFTTSLSYDPETKALTSKYTDNSERTVTLNIASNLQEVTDNGRTTTNDITVVGYNKFLGIRNYENEYATAGFKTDADGLPSILLYSSASEQGAEIRQDLLTERWTYQFPDKGGIFALLDDIILPTGLEAIDEGNGIGWRLIGRDPALYGNIGEDAIDFSTTDTAHVNRGAVGNSSFAFGWNVIDTPTGGQNFLIGNFPTATGTSWYNIIGGYQNTVNNAYGVLLMGQDSVYSGGSLGVGGGISTGRKNTITGYFISGIGTALQGTGSYATILGVSNVNFTDNDQGNTSVQRRLLVVGNGTCSGTGTRITPRDAFLVYFNGEVVAPSLTTALIDAEATGRVLTTREWVNSKLGTGYVPYTGATTNIDLNAKNLSNVNSLTLVNNGTITNASTGGLQIRPNGVLTLTTVNQNTNYVRITGANNPVDAQEAGIRVVQIGKSFTSQGVDIDHTNFQTKTIELNSIINHTSNPGASFHRSIYINPTYLDTGITHYAIDSERGKMRFGGYGANTYTGTPTYNLGVDVNGNVIEVPLENKIANKTANYTLLLTDKTIIVNATTGNLTMTLPTAASAFNASNSTGLIYTIKRKASDVSGNTVTVVVTGGGLIDNEVTQLIPFASAMRVQSDGIEWHII